MMGAQSCFFHSYLFIILSNYKYMSFVLEVDIIIQPAYTRPMCTHKMLLCKCSRKHYLFRNFECIADIAVYTKHAILYIPSISTHVAFHASNLYTQDWFDPSSIADQAPASRSRDHKKNIWLHYRAFLIGKQSNPKISAMNN